MIELTGLLRNVIKEFGGSAVNFAPTKSAKCGKKSCKKGLPCRGSCIAANKKCKSELPEKTKPLVAAVKKAKPKRPKKPEVVRAERFGESSYSHRSEVRSVVITPDGQRVISASREHDYMIVWNLATKRKEKEIMGGGIFGDDIRAMAVTPDGQRVVTRRQSSLTVTNIATGKDEIVIETAKSALTKSASITPDGKRVVTTGGNDGSVEMWNIETGKLEKSFKGHKYRVYAATATPDGKRVVTGGTIWIAP